MDERDWIAMNRELNSPSGGKLSKHKTMSLKGKFNIEDVKRAYFAGFEKNSEIANERLNSWHWQKAAEAFQEWLEKELLGAESVKK